MSWTLTLDEPAGREELVSALQQLSVDGDDDQASRHQVLGAIDAVAELTGRGLLGRGPYTATLSGRANTEPGVPGDGEAFDFIAIHVQAAPAMDPVAGPTAEADQPT